MSKFGQQGYGYPSDYAVNDPRRAGAIVQEQQEINGYNNWQARQSTGQAIATGLIVSLVTYLRGRKNRG